MNAQMPPEAGTETVATAANPRKKIVMGIAAAVVLAYAGHAWWFNAHYVETDNAQEDGHIIPVSPKIGGFIATILVQENQSVNAGDVLGTMDDRDYRSKVVQARADLAPAMANSGGGKEAGQAVAQLGAASAQAEAARADIAQAEADFDRATR